MIRARKRFGQHFLEPAWVVKVVRAIDPRPDDVFLEIGPGRGALTFPLAARAKAVVAYEIDRDLVADLERTAPPNVRIRQVDFLQAPIEVGKLAEPDCGGEPAQRVRAAGNLPYNIASRILFRLVELYAAGVPIADATVMLQREVADRLLAKPGTRDYGVLTVLIRHSAHVEQLLALPPGAFRPPPKVHSALVRLRFHAPDPPVRDARVFATLVQAVFTRRRKTLANALQAYTTAGLPAATALDGAGLDGRRRPETLTIAEFARLADILAVQGR